jgi:hypothetical protein
VIARYQVLSRRIERELEELERTQAAAQRWQTARATAVDQDTYLNSVALNLRSFCAGLERIFELIAPRTRRRRSGRRCPAHRIVAPDGA